MDSNFTDIQAIVSEMIAGNRDAILSGLQHEGALVRINGIMNAVTYQYTSDEVIKLLSQLKEDTIVIDGYRVSQFATAALHVLKIENYNGDDEQINELIDSGFDF